MNQLYCYAITPRALQLLVPSTQSLLLTPPEGWFNWRDANKRVEDGRMVQRLSVLDPETSDTPVLRWSRAGEHAGYACMLIYSTEDPPLHTDNATGLADSVVLHPLDPQAVNDSEMQNLLALLREPEEFFQIGWEAVTWGGGANIVDGGSSARMPMAHWWAYGQGLRKWIAKTAGGKPEARYRRNCADYSVWNVLKAQGIDHPDIKLDTRWCWDSAQQDAWPWDLTHPCTLSDIPEMAYADIVAYYPMRQMPCCGLAQHKDGRLLTIGALPDERGPDGAWVWDDGLLQRIMVGMTKPQRPVERPALLERVMTIVANALGSIGAPTLAPKWIGMAHSEMPDRHLAVDNGVDQIIVAYNGLRIRMDPTSRAGPTAIDPLWLTAFSQIGDDVKIVGQWVLANQIIEAPFQVVSDQIAFVISANAILEK